jgi:hypothetical protein
MTGRMFGHVYAYVTAERITAESATHGDYSECGWVDDVGSHDIFESRNDVRPIMVAHPDDEDFGERVRDAIDTLGAYITDDGSTFDGIDSHPDYVSGDDYVYGIHFSRAEHRLSPGREEPFTVTEWLES